MKLSTLLILVACVVLISTFALNRSTHESSVNSTKAAVVNQGGYNYVEEFDYKGHTYTYFHYSHDSYITHAGHCKAHHQ